MIVLLVACGAKDEPVACPPADGALLWLSTSDFFSEVGALAAIDPADGTLYDSLASTWPDSLVRVRDGVPFVLGRGLADAVRVYDDRCFAAPTLEIPLPPGTNAHDLEVVGDAWFVSAYDAATLLVLDPSGDLRGEVDLAPWADADGLPDPDQLLVVGDELAVALQNLEGGRNDAGAGRIAVVDTASLAVDRVYDVGPNPKLYGHPAAPGSAIVLTGLFFDATDGAISVVDLASGAIEVVLAETVFGLDFYDYAEADGYGAIVGVDEEYGSLSEVFCIDWSTGAWTPGPVTPSFLADLTPGDDGTVWIVARSGRVEGADDGVFQLDPKTCSEISGWTAPSLEPYSIAVLE